MAPIAPRQKRTLNLLLYIHSRERGNNLKQGREVNLSPEKLLLMEIECSKTRQILTMYLVNEVISKRQGQNIC